LCSFRKLIKVYPQPLPPSTDPHPYRLLPESSFVEQLEDIEDAEKRIWNTPPTILYQVFEWNSDGQKIAVLKVSSGGHLALLTVGIP
jgi:acetyl esterase/lipase